MKIGSPKPVVDLNVGDMMDGSAARVLTQEEPKEVWSPIVRVVRADNLANDNVNRVLAFFLRRGEAREAQEDGVPILGLGYVVVSESHWNGKYSAICEKCGWIDGGKAGFATHWGSLVEAVSDIVTFGGADFDFPDLSSEARRYVADGSSVKCLLPQTPPIELWRCGHRDMLRALCPDANITRAELGEVLLKTASANAVRLFVEMDGGGFHPELLQAGYVMGLYFLWLQRAGRISPHEQRVATESLRQGLGAAKEIL